MIFILTQLALATKIFAPYVDVTGNFDLTPYASAGLSKFTMAFGNTVCSTSKLVIGQNIPFEEKKALVDSIRAKGGDVILSFGGALQDSAKDPAACGYDAQKVQQIYQKFIDFYNLTFIDLDIEGAALNDKASVEIRSVALSALKKANPGLVVSITVPVSPSGLLENALNALRSAKNAGLVYDYVNIMAMDYGAAVTAMGDAAISASKGTIAQLDSLNMASTKLGITPMIGKNDGDSGTFTVADAQALTTFSNGNDRVGLLAFWQLSADANAQFSKVFLASAPANVPPAYDSRIRRTSNVITTDAPAPTVLPPAGNTTVATLSTNVCGQTWVDAVQACTQACPGGVDRECPNGQKCFDIKDSACRGVAVV